MIFFFLRSLRCGEEIRGMQKSKQEGSLGGCSGRREWGDAGVVLVGWQGEEKLTWSCVLKAELPELVNGWHAGCQGPGQLIFSA